MEAWSVGEWQQWLGHVDVGKVLVSEETIPDA